MDVQSLFQAYFNSGPTISACAPGRVNLMGAPVMTIPEKCDAASPITYVNSESTPIFIQQGTDDLIIPYPQSIMLAEKMTTAIGKENVILELVENADHSDPVFFTLENIHKVLDFFGFRRFINVLASQPD